MKRTTAPLLVVIASGVAAVGVLAAITGPVIHAVDNGASWWWLTLLCAPLLVAAAGIGASAWLDHQLHRTPEPPPLKPDGVDAAFAEIRGALNTLAEQTVVPRQFVPKQRNDSELS